MTSDSAIKKGIFWVFSTSIVWQIISWVLTLFTARILSSKDYGLLAIADAFFPYLLMLSTLKIDEWLLQTKEKSSIAQRNSLTILLFSATICTVLGFLIAPLVANYYSAPELAPALQLVSFIFLPRALRVIPESIKRQKYEFKEIALANLNINIARGILQLLLAYWGLSYWSLVIGGIFYEIALTLYFIRKEGFIFSLGADKEIIKQIIKYGFFATGSMALWVIFSTVDNLIVGKLFGLEILGFYAMAFYLSDLPLAKINSFLNPVLTPLYAKLSNHKEELNKTFLFYNQLIVSFLFPAYIILFLVAEDLTKVALGNSWSGLVEPLRFFCVLGLFKTISANVSLVFNAIGLPKYNFLVSLLGVLILPFSFFILGKQFGLKGIFFSWLIIYPIIGPFLQIYLSKKVLDYNFISYLKNILTPFSCSLYASIVIVSTRNILFLNETGFMSLISQLTFATITYIITFFFTDRKNFNELSNFLGFQPKKLD